jgi:hypothetical protein
MANIIQIKRRTSGSAGAPASLANGELAFNEVDNTLYYGFQSGVSAIAGYGYFTTVDTSQTLSGSKTFSSSVVLSSAVAETKATATSAASVATTEFVQNVFSLLDGGDFDGAGGGGQSPSGFVILGSGEGVSGSDFNNPANWTLSGGSTATLPTSTDVVTVSSSNAYPNNAVYINIDQWVKPAMIVVQSGTIAVRSLEGRSFSLSVLSGSNYTLQSYGNVIITN